MPSADGFDRHCFPNPFFCPNDVTICYSTPNHTITTIDLSRGSPSPEPSAVGTDNSDDDILPPLITPDPSEDGESDDGGEDDSQSDPPAGQVAVAVDSLRADLPYTIANVFTQFLRLHNDDFVASNFRSMFGGSEAGYEYPPIEYWYARLDDGEYALLPQFANMTTTQLRSLAGVVVTSLNSEVVGPRGFEPGAVTVSVSLAAIDECRIVCPAISLLLSNGWDLCGRVYPNEARIHKLVEDVLYGIRFGEAVIGKVTACTLHLGEHSVCNPGAGIGMGQDEFLDRVSFQPGITSRVESWLNPLLFGGSSIRAADAAYGRLLRPEGFAEFLVFEDDEKTSIIPLRQPDHEGVTSRTYICVEDLARALFERGFEQ
ncbi:hypothetical protein K438DRAFT_1781132 [Mycena galopus ATCC 62051]|nr:hypothetical protein K438DRAFT_1781132 [Mycena galopus ATCC 62051]